MAFPVAGPTSAISPRAVAGAAYSIRKHDERRWAVHPAVVALQLIPALIQASSRERRCAKSALSFRVSALLLVRQLCARVIGVTYVLLFKEMRRSIRFFLRPLPCPDPRSDEPQTIVVGWIFLPSARSSARCGRRRHAPTRRIFRSSRDVAAGSEDFRRLICWAVYRSSCSRRAGSAVPPRGLSVGNRLRHRAAQRPVSYFMTKSHNSDGESKEVRKSEVGLRTRTSQF